MEIIVDAYTPEDHAMAPEEECQHEMLVLILWERRPPW